MTNVTTELNRVLKDVEDATALNERSAIKLAYVNKRVKEALGVDIFLLKEVMDFTDSQRLMLERAATLLKESLKNRTDDVLLLAEINKEAT